jgi:hypothetical protein
MSLSSDFWVEQFFFNVTLFFKYLILIKDNVKTLDLSKRLTRIPNGIIKFKTGLEGFTILQLAFKLYE